MKLRRPTMLLATPLLCALAGFTACGDENEISVKGLEPRQGGIQGDQSVTITGQFRNDIGYTVYFGTTRAEFVSVQDEGHLVTVAPKVPKGGKVDVVVIADTGPGFRMREAFLYQTGGGSIMEHVGSTEEQAPQAGSGSNLLY